MRIARVAGTVTSTSKDPKLSAHPLLIVDVMDARGQVVEQSLVVVDTRGACVGETVLVVRGSAARVPEEVSGTSTDATIVAIVDEISVVE